MDTPAQRLQKKLNELFQKFLKTPFAIPAAIGLAAVVFALTLIYLSTFCLAGLITPLAMLGIFWYFGIKSVKKLVIFGIVACFAFSAVYTAFYTDLYNDVEQKFARSTDYELTNGTVTPFRGDGETTYNFTLTVNLPNEDATVSSVSVGILSLDFPWATGGNYTMTQYAHNGTTNTSYYSYETKLSRPVNQFIFWAKINDTWFVATDHQGDQEYALFGPMYSNTWAIVATVIPVSIINTFTSVFIIYGLLVFMVWWTRRARQMRLKAYEKATTQREEQMKDLPGKEEAKVPSLAVATGAAADGSFVCSECGADVPADATVCPKCGEKFE